MKLFAVAAIALVLAAAPALAAPPKPLKQDVLSTAANLKAAALAGDGGFDRMRRLVEEVGPRQAGTAAEARARAWAQAEFKAIGLASRVEPFTMQSWARTGERAALTGPAPLSLKAHALGYAPPTPAGGIEGEVARFATLDALKAAPEAEVRGKIVFLDEVMNRTESGAGYGPAVRKRRECAPAAAAKGAVACVIRTVGTSPHRFANTGMMGKAGQLGVLPAAALANVDADALARRLAQGPQRLRLDIQAEILTEAASGNVIAEIKGRTRTKETVLVAAHIDSWDLTPGAQDDAVGVAVVMEAARLINALPKKPRRNVRIVLFGAEEQGLLGAEHYVKANAAALGDHIVAVEADSGAGKILSLQSRVAPAGLPAMQQAGGALADLGITMGGNEASGGPDLQPLRKAGVPVIDLEQDMTSYFDVHHTENDTIAQVDPANVKQMAAAYAAIVYLLAEMDGSFRPITQPAEPAP